MMEHNFSTKHPITFNLIPQWEIGDTVKVISNQHTKEGFIGKIVDIFPNQSNVFYVLEWKGHRLTSIPERMLEKVE